MAEGSSSPSSFSSAAAAKAEEERAEVLDRKLTRLAIADDDDKLEPALVKTLPYSIASLSASSPSIRMMVDALRRAQYSIRKLIDNRPAIHTIFETLMDIHDHIESVLEHVKYENEEEEMVEEEM